MLRSKRMVVGSLVFALIFIVWMPNGLAAQKTFKLGILAPLTGGAAKSGTEIRDGAKLAFKEINYKIGDYQVELIPMDDQSDPVKGTNAYAEAIERKGVQAGILNWNTAVSVAIQKMLVRYKIPHFFAMGAGQAVNDAWKSLPANDRYLMMKGWALPHKLWEGYTPCINSTIEKGTWRPQKKLVALWGEDTDMGRTVVAAFRKYVTAGGWEVFSEDYFPYDKSEFYSYLNKNKNAGVSLIAGESGSLPTVSAMLKQGQEIGFQGMKIINGLGYFGNWYEMTGPASDSVLDMQPKISTPAQIAWTKAFKSEYGYDPSPSAAGMSYDYAKFFIKIAKRAIEKHGELTSDTLTKIGRDEVQTGLLTYSREEGALMHARYRTDGANAPDPVVGWNDFCFPIIQYKAGTGYVVYPNNMKEMEIMAPK